MECCATATILYSIKAVSIPENIRGLQTIVLILLFHQSIMEHSSDAMDGNLNIHKKYKRFHKVSRNIRVLQTMEITQKQTAHAGTSFLQYLSYEAHRAHGSLD
jgi:hypothetical protein